MPAGKKIIGYNRADGDIYRVECIKKNYEAMQEQIENAMTGDDLEETEIVCDGCQMGIK